MEITSLDSRVLSVQSKETWFECHEVDMLVEHLERKEIKKRKQGLSTVSLLTFAIVLTEPVSMTSRAKSSINRRSSFDIKFRWTAA